MIGVTLPSSMTSTLSGSMNVLMTKSTATPEAVITAYDGHQAVELARTEAPALIVLDLMLPELDGFEAMRIIRADSDAPVLLLTARSSLPERILGLEKGADDYLPKPFSPAELVVRVKAVLRRVHAVGAAPDGVAEVSSTLNQNDIAIDTERYEVRRDGQLIPLTPVEFKLLVTLVSAEGRALTRDQLLDAVYGSDDGDVLDRTIDVHIGRLREKLDDDADQPRYVMTVRGVGYRAAPSST